LYKFRIEYKEKRRIVTGIFDAVECSYLFPVLDVGAADVSTVAAEVR
jgi:hypothetical protein